jgi:hypothetical protein
MRITSISIVAALLCFVAAPAMAKDGDSDLICAVVDVYVCGYEEPCHRAKPDAINAPDFLKIDLKEKTIVGRRHDGSYGTFKVTNQVKTPKLVFLQGMQKDDSDEDNDDAVAWSMTLNIDSGRMSAAISGDRAAYTLFGNCHTL